MNANNVEEVNNDDPMEMINEVDMDEDEMVNIGMPFEMQIINHARQDLERRQYIGAIFLLCNVVHALHLLEILSACLHSRVSDVSPQREHRRRELMRYLVTTHKCRDIIRMGLEAFLKLCQKARGTGIVKDNIQSTVEEQVAKFLHIIGHNVKNRAVTFFFHRFRETVSCAFTMYYMLYFFWRGNFWSIHRVAMSHHKYLIIADSIHFSRYHCISFS